MIDRKGALIVSLITLAVLITVLSLIGVGVIEIEEPLTPLDKVLIKDYPIKDKENGLRCNETILEGKVIERECRNFEN